MNKRTILITGGTGMIGQQLVVHFLKLKYKVIITARSNSSVERSISKLNKKYLENFISIIVDFSHKEAAQKIVNTLTRLNIWPEVIIHNARSVDNLTIEKDGFSSTSKILNEYLVDVALPYEITRLIIEVQTKLILNNIIFVSSIYGIVAPNPSLYENFEKSSPIQYGLAKAAQIQLTKELAVRLSNKDIRVNCISFGGIEGRVDDDFKKRYSNLTPYGGMLKPDDVIKPIDFLVSDGSGQMTGHNLVIDGGWTIW